MVREGQVQSYPVEKVIDKNLGLLRLPPLDNLRFFESAARHESFARAAAELGVTPGAVAHRVRTLENSLDTQLFERHQRGVVLSNRGRSYLKDVQRILEDIYRASEDLRRKPQRLRIISIEAIAEKWLIPRLGALKAAHPDITVELDTGHHSIDASGRDFDTWIAYTGGDRCTASGDRTRRRPDRGNVVRGESDRRLQPGIAGGEGPAEQPGRASQLAPGVRSRLGKRLGLLVRLSESTSAGSFPSFSFPPVQHGHRRRPKRTGSGYRSSCADRAGTGTGEAGASPEPPKQGSSTVLSVYQSCCPEGTSNPVIPPVGPCRQPSQATVHDPGEPWRLRRGTARGSGRSIHRLKGLGRGWEGLGFPRSATVASGRSTFRILALGECRRRLTMLASQEPLR